MGGYTDQGAAVGAWVGAAVGDAVGAAVGAAVGTAVGDNVGVAEGAAVGDADGTAVGEIVGAAVECIDYARTKMATRFVMVTDDAHGNAQLKELRDRGVKLWPYNPFDDGGPWKVDGGEMKAVTSGFALNGTKRNHTTEFVFLDNVPMTDNTLIKITTNVHDKQCKKKGDYCPERGMQLCDIVDAVLPLIKLINPEFDELSFVTNEVRQRFRVNALEIVKSVRRGKFRAVVPQCPEIVTVLQLGESYYQDGHDEFAHCCGGHFPQGITFNDYLNNAHCKAVCESVDVDYRCGDAAAKALVDAISRGETVLTPNQWMAVLASFRGLGPVPARSSNQLKTAHQVRLIGVVSEVIAALPADFLTWWVRHSWCGVFY
jgi:hypothetical protein